MSGNQGRSTEESPRSPNRKKASGDGGRPATRVVGDRVLLRTISMDDLPRIEQWWEEREANTLDAGSPEAPSFVFQRAFRQRIRDGAERDWMLIVRREAGLTTPVGYLIYRTYPEEPGAAEVALRVSQTYWGRGLGSEAFRLFVDHMFRTRSFDQLWLTVYSFNPRAMRVYQKAGFQDDDVILDEQGKELIKMSLTRAQHEARGVQETNTNV